jgi:RNA polymerase sigma-70 factor, ECF subfamily
MGFQPTDIQNPTISARATSGGDSGYEVLEIYEKFYRNLYVYCMRRLFVPELAEDATAATFLKLVEKFGSLRGQTRLEISGWLYGTASNVASGMICEKKSRAKIFQELSRARGQFCQESIKEIGKLDWPTLYGAILQLKRPQQDAIVLRFFEGFETNEIADILGLKPVTARVTLSRAIRRLRKNLEVSLGDS